MKPTTLTILAVLLLSAAAVQGQEPAPAPPPAVEHGHGHAHGHGEPAPTPPRAASPAPHRSLYDRIAARLATRDDLATLDQVPPQLAEVSWMLGTWDVEVTVFATPESPQSVERGVSEIAPALKGHWLQLADTYPAGTQDLGFLTYNRVTREWVSLGLDSFGNSVLAKGAGWDGRRLILIAAGVEVLGEVVTLRQTVEKRGADEFVLLNEEKLPDGTWLPLDQYRYRRRPAG